MEWMELTRTTQVIKDKYAPALNNQTMLIKLIPKTTVAYNETIRAMKAGALE